MPPTTAILSTASTTPLLSTRHEWPIKRPLHLTRELSGDVATSSPSSSQNGVYHKYNSPRFNTYQKTSTTTATTTTAEVNDLPFELQDHHHHHDSEIGNDSDEEVEVEEQAPEEEEEEEEKEEEEEEKEEEEELHSLERVGFQPDNHKTTNRNYQVRLCIAQVVRVYPPGSASMVDIRDSGFDDGACYTIDNLPNSRSVRDVSTLPDLLSSAAQAILFTRCSGSDDDGLGRSEDEAAEAEGRGGGEFVFDSSSPGLKEEKIKIKNKNKNKKNKKRMVMQPEENGKGLRRALKKRISTPRFGFQGGSVRELVRSIGF